MFTCIQTVDCVAAHPEFAFLSSKFRITEHSKRSVAECFDSFQAEFTRNLRLWI